MYLFRIFEKKSNVSITYDNEQGGADYIVHFDSTNLIIEVGS